MRPLPVIWRAAAAALLVLACLLGTALGVQTARLHQAEAALERDRAQHAAQREAWAEGARAAAQRYREIEAQRSAAHQEIVNDARTALNLARRDAGRAAVAADGLRRAAARAAAACGGAPTGDTAAADGGEAAAGPGLVLADVLGRADGAAGELAAALDASRAAGLACERAYDALAPGS